MSTGAGNDNRRATELARKMVLRVGMSTLGPLTFGKKEEQIFLAAKIAQHRDYSETLRSDRLRSPASGGRRIHEGQGLAGGQPRNVTRIALALLEREVLDAERN